MPRVHSAAVATNQMLFAIKLSKKNSRIDYYFFSLRFPRNDLKDSNDFIE